MKKNNTPYSLRGWLLVLFVMLLPASVLADEVVVADANGNELIYTYETADGPATFKGIKTYSTDEAKAGRIVIAGSVKDASGNNHEVQTIKNSLTNRSNIVTVDIPASVTTIGSSAFSSASKLQTVTFAAGNKLTTIESSAFSYCKALVSINLEACQQLTTLADYWLYNCPSVTSLTIPASVTEFGSWGLNYTDIETLTFLAAAVPNYFYNSHSKLHTINIGPGVKSIGEYAFSSNYKLKNINIDKDASDLNIMNSAFQNCDGLKTVTIPANITTFGESVFYDCDSLETVNFAVNSPLKEIPKSTFAYCYRLATITLPDAVETVGESAFYDCSSLTEVVFGPGLKTLEARWIFSYDPVQKIVLPGAQNPFKADIGLSNDVTLYVHPDLVDDYRNNEITKRYHIMAIGQTTEFAVTTTAGGQLQAKMEAISDPNNALTLTVSGPLNGTDIDYLHTLPNIEVLNLTDASIVAGGDSYHQWNVGSNGIATINTYYGPWNTEDNVVGHVMFYNMPRLRSISLPKGVTKIGTWALGQEVNFNKKLTHIDIPAGVTEIGDHAFAYTGIEEVTIPEGVTRLEPCTFYHCENLLKATLPDGITYIGGSCFSECYALTEANIPAKVELIDEYAFYNNFKRTSPIILPATLKTIGYRAFYANRVVKNITFAEGLETIKAYAFNDCNAVESIQLPESITTIEYCAFEDCDSITEFVFPQNIKVVPEGILYSCDKLQKVVLAAGTTQLGHYAFGYCPQLADINISTMNTLTSTGYSVFYQCGFTTMTLPNSITEMSYNAFSGCQQLTTINVPTGIDYVPEEFCSRCPKLVSVTMHDSIRTIRDNAFYQCKALTDIQLNDDITSIEYNAFRECESLAITSLPKALTFIGDAAFMNMKLFTGELAIPEGVTQIDHNAFNGTAISAVTLPKGINHWGQGLFAHCEQLTSVALPENFKRITNYMFQYCKSLESIQVPDSLKEVGYAAFDHAGLTAITLPDSLSVIESYAFSNTQLKEFRVPEGLKGDPGSYTWENCKRLKSIYLGRDQDYSQLTSFSCLNGCDSLQLLRIYAGTPPQCNTWYMGYRTTCVLEVPEDAIALYQEANGWKEFKEIKGFFDGDLLNDIDFAVLKSVYNKLDGKSWQKPWDLSNNHRSIGKWMGVTTVGDYITEIDLSNQGLKGELPDSLFMLPKLEKLNLSGNQIQGDLATVMKNVAVNNTITEVNVRGNKLSGDAYALLAKTPNITMFDVSYNQLTEMSEVFPNNKLADRYFYHGYQFVDFKTKKVVDGAPAIDMKAGIPSEITFNTLQKYRHDYGDYNYAPSSMARIGVKENGEIYTSWELTKNDDNLWNLYSGSSNHVLQAEKGVPTAYTATDPWWSNKTYILRYDWTDGDVNADLAVDVTDLQSVIYYAMNDYKVSGQMFNYSTADANSDNKINVSDVIGSVDYVLAYEITDGETNAPTYYNRAPSSSVNIMSVNGQQMTLTNTDAVAALQVTVNGASARQIRINDAVRSNFSVAVRDVADGVRIVIYSAEGHMLTAGQHAILSGLPTGAFIADVRLSDSEARHLEVTMDRDVTGINVLREAMTDGHSEVYDLRGRRLDNWQTLPSGIYVIRVNGKQYKVKK